MHYFDDTLELYALGRLNTRTRKEVEKHLLACERCRRMSTQIEIEVAAIRRALEKFVEHEEETSLSAVV